MDINRWSSVRGKRMKSKKRSSLTFSSQKWLLWAVPGLFTQRHKSSGLLRVDMRGNREGRYISCHDILIGLSKSLPPLPLPPSSVFHHPSTNNGSSHPFVYNLADQCDWFLPQQLRWSKWEERLIERECETKVTRQKDGWRERGGERRGKTEQKL